MLSVLTFDLSDLVQHNLTFNTCTFDLYIFDRI